jgi:cell division transport system ATP-binding protein
MLRDVSFSLQPGSFHFLTGPSGAGKSSLLKLIYLAARPSKGAITLFGQDLAVLPARQLPMLRRRIGVVFQDFCLLDHLSAFDNAALPLRIAGGKPKAYKNDVAELLAWVGLGCRLHAMPDTLLADEPTGNVDPEMAVRILHLFVQLNRQGTTVLIATHDRHLVERAGIPQLHLDQGRLALRSGLDAVDP